MNTNAPSDRPGDGSHGAPAPAGPPAAGDATAAATGPRPDALPDYLEARRRALPYDLGWRPDTDPAAWREGLRAIWRDLLPPIGATGTAAPDGAVALRHATGAVATGRLTLPPGPGPHPGVVLFHEHGGAFATGWEKLHDHPASARTRAALYGGRAVARACAAAGMATLTCDAPCFGRRQAGGHAGQQALAASATALGWSLAGLAAAEAAGAADWLAAHPRIARVGTFGFSMGAVGAWSAAALSPRVAATAALGWMACRADLMAPGRPLLAGHSAWHFVHPGLSHRADFPDLAGLGADRPMFLRSGRGDRHMPEVSVAQAWHRIAAIAAVSGARPPDTAFHDAGHTCPPATLDEAVAFLAHHLAA
ncbi:hypothetical protein EKE94_13470 [Mesobaculum littorinae]|uniref:Uncharacterized protein n=1 Tax=Mesobaculum littorinae TaxID=2486419 RepID=A0A438AFP4_9RHOB|nr:hypothetical protein [Mesobaculum littorinae]RVV97543.1 hypothetical protein EKE94_13470 [Mesobaculum littorinae]